MHVLKDYDQSKNLWLSPIEPKLRSNFFVQDLDDQFLSNISQNLNQQLDHNWSRIWGVAIFLLWKWHNQKIFDPTFHPSDKPKSIILNYVANILHATDDDQSETSQYNYISQDICPNPPQVRQVQLNVDEASKGNLGLVGYGGLIRDVEGRWLSRFTQNLGICNSLMVEFWGEIHGLKAAQNLGFRRILLESDLRNLTSTLTQNKTSNLMAKALFLQCQHILSRDWQVVIQLQYREDNRCANGLTNHIQELERKLTIYKNPLPRIHTMLLGDDFRVSAIRMICNQFSFFRLRPFMITKKKIYKEPLYFI